MFRRITGGIRMRLIILVVGITLPLGYVGLSGIRAMWDASRQQLDGSLKTQAQMGAIAFEQWIGAQREPLAAIGAYFADEPSRGPQFRKALGFFVDNRAHWIGVRILDRAGHSLLTHPVDSPPLPPEYLSRDASQFESQAWAIDTDWTRGPSKGILLLSVPVSNGGAVVAQLNVTSISESLFRDLHLPDEGTLAVYGPQRRVLLYRNPIPETYVGSDLSNSPLFAALDHQSPATTEVNSPIDGVPRVYGLALAGESDAVVTVGLPEKVLYEPARRQLDRYVALSLAALLCALIAALIITRSIALPLRRLNEAAQRFGAGAFSTRAPIKGGEVGELALSFNSMAAQIEEREARLTELDRLKSDFVSGVSHELRTPLTTIKTLTRVLLRSALTERERREYLETIAAECDRQIDLVLNVLDLSRIEAGTYSTAAERLDVGELIKAVITISRYSAESHGHQLVAEIPDRPLSVIADRAALRRVLSGLVENAIKYTPHSGRITLSARREATYIQVTVADTGRGISKEDLPHIFEKFYRGRFGQHTTGELTSVIETSDYSGVGLGLYLAQTIVGQMGGHITVQSRLGQGATFTVHVPTSDDINGGAVQRTEAEDGSQIAPC